MTGIEFETGFEALCKRNRSCKTCPCDSDIRHAANMTCREAYAYIKGMEAGAEKALDDLWDMAVHKYDEALCLEELASDIDDIKEQTE